MKVDRINMRIPVQQKETYVVLSPLASVHEWGASLGVTGIKGLGGGFKEMVDEGQGAA